MLALFDETRSWGLLVAVPAAVLTGLAFALPISAWSSTRYGGGSFPTIIRFGLLPMFLFGGAFFPIDELPGWLQPVAYVTPLWHGIELCRGAVIESVSPGNVGVHLAVLGGVHRRRLDGVPGVRSQGGWRRDDRPAHRADRGARVGPVDRTGWSSAA